MRSKLSAASATIKTLLQLAPAAAKSEFVMSSNVPVSPAVIVTNWFPSDKSTCRPSVEFTVWAFAFIVIAKFENNESLARAGKNLFRESRASGEAAMGKPGETGRGRILSKSIELSNVDIANEFVALMTAQRNFQANAKTISTADQMLQEVLNIKR